VTAFQYPHDLVFELPPGDNRRDAVLRSADILALPTSTDGALIRVTVRSPQETYRFGRVTGEFLGQDVPAPVPMTSTP
jgi:hypothetical protein